MPNPIVHWTERLIASLALAICSLALMASGAAAQQQQAPAIAPIPVQITTAKNVFISNLGADPGGLAILLDEIKDPNAAYNQFYAAMKSWGHFNIVSKPSDADLVFELSLVDHGSFPARMTLVIFDEQTHFPLWTVTEPLQPAARQATWQKNFATCLNTFVGDVKHLAAPLE